MKKSIIIIICLVCWVSLYAQEKVYIHKSDKITLGALISKTDSIYFNNDGTLVYFSIGDTLVQYSRSVIDSLSFGNNDTTIYINYSGTSAAVINPLAFEGVNVTVDGADVVVTQTGEIRDISYKLTGTTTDGMFKIYSEKRFNLLLNGVNITNSNGPAINIQSENKVFVNLTDGTSNILTDGINYAAAVVKPNGNTEDQKAAFFSEGKLVFGGAGNLTINGHGTDKHALCSDETIEFENGSTTVTSAAVDAIHTKEGIKVLGGALNVKSTGDGIDAGGGYFNMSGGSIFATTTVADSKGISCDSTIVISGGTIQLTVGGNQSKGLKSGKDMTLSGGTISITTTGGVALAVSGLGYEPTYCTAIKCDSSILISGANITITASGAAAKGLSADKNMVMTSGYVSVTSSGTGTTYTNSVGAKDSYSSVCVDADGDMGIIGGTLITNSSGAGGKGIASDGEIILGQANTSLAITITTSGAKFLVSGTDYCHPKAVRSTGALTVNNGTINISSSDDGMHSDASITVNGGATTVSKSVEGVESKYIYLNGGITNVTATNDGFNATMSTVSGGTEQNDNSYLYINGGTHAVNATGGDAIDSNGNVEMNGGVMVANGPLSGMEEAADFNGSFNMKGGFFIGAGSSSNMTKAMSTTSTQRNLYLTTTTAILSTTLFRIQDPSGNDIITFKPLNGGYKFLFSSTALATGVTYSLYTGGSSTGTVSNGLYTGGTYSGGTLKKSFTLSTTSTLTSVTF